MQASYPALKKLHKSCLAALLPPHAPRPTRPLPARPPPPPPTPLPRPTLPKTPITCIPKVLPALKASQCSILSGAQSQIEVVQDVNRQAARRVFGVGTCLCLCMRAVVHVFISVFTSVCVYYMSSCVSVCVCVSPSLSLSLSRSLPLCFALSLSLSRACAWARDGQHGAQHVTRTLQLPKQLSRIHLAHRTIQH